MLADWQRRNYAIVPSYGSNNMGSDVYFAAAESIMTQDLDLRLLADTSGRETEGGLPTWAPDWSYPALCIDKDFWNHFEAGAGRRAQVEVLQVKRELKLCGCMVDVIKLVGSSDEGGDVSDTLAASQALFVGSSQLANDLCGLNSYYRTLTLDTWSSISDPNADPEYLKNEWSLILDWHSKKTNSFGREILGWRFFVSDNASPGMATKNAEPRDMVFLPWGSKMPFAVRRFGDQADRYQIIGLYYLHGMMYGEVVSLDMEGKMKSEYMYLV